MRRRALAGAALLAIIAAAIVVGPAAAERVQLGKLILDVDGGFSPKVLPKKGYAPITIKGGGKLSTTDGSLPPAASHITIDWDRNGLLNTKGLPVCQPNKLEATTTQQAIKACRPALVGQGFASGLVAFPEDPPFAASSKIWAFNGPRRGGKWTLILHAYAFVPAPTTFVVPVTITKTKNGRYGYRSEADAPVIAGGYGVVTDFNLKVGRKWKSKGKRQNYISARCADGRLQAQLKADFVDSSSLQAHVFRPCKSKG